jgi:hypothetical protein
MHSWVMLKMLWCSPTQAGKIQDFQDLGFRPPIL